MRLPSACAGCDPRQSGLRLDKPGSRADTARLQDLTPARLSALVPPHLLRAPHRSVSPPILPALPDPVQHPRHPERPRRLLLASLALTCCAPWVQARPANANALADAEPAPQLLKLPVNAKHAVVLDAGSGRVLLDKNADAVVPIASLTKLMTAMVLLDAKPDMNEKIRIDREDVDMLKHSASRLPVGAEMTRLAALKLALMVSENRATAALARTFPGGLSAFKQAMQAKIRALGLNHTAISEPTGLSPANTSTAMEVAKIAQAAERYPQISAITSERKDRVPINGRPRELHNTNRLVGAKGWDIRLSKTGYTEEAGRCLTMRLRTGGKNVTVVLLDADGSAQRLRDAAKIRQSLNNGGRRPQS